MLPPGYTAVHNSRLPWTVLFNLFCFVLCVCFVPCIFCVFLCISLLLVFFIMKNLIIRRKKREKKIFDYSHVMLSYNSVYRESVERY